MLIVTVILVGVTLHCRVTITLNPLSVLLWGDLDQDQGSKICLDHGA